MYKKIMATYTVFYCKKKNIVNSKEAKNHDGGFCCATEHINLHYSYEIKYNYDL